MKQLLIIVISLIAASSCKADFSIIDTMKNKDKTLARILDYEVEDNERLRIRFDTSVLLADYRFNGKRIEAYGYGNEILINLPYTLSYGEEATVSITVKKDTGNYTRASLRIEGHNENLPRMLINELSTDGTSAAPDRVELYAITSGDTAGITISAGSGNETVSLPSIIVSQGDIIVVYWDKIPKENDYTRPSGRTVFIYGKAKNTIPSKNGVLMLKSSRSGYILDALIYSDSNGESFSEKTEKDAQMIIDSDHWSGEFLDSSSITASRVFARRPGAVDSDTAYDWFITQPRKSTFGDENIYAPFNGDE